MTQYIDKDVVVTEIERRRDESWLGMYTKEKGIIFDITDYILSFLDTIEVKEVDLEKEFDNYTKNILACDVQFEPFTHLYNCAKYFYELGLKTKDE